MHWLRALGLFAAAAGVVGVVACGGDDEYDDDDDGGSSAAAGAVKVTQDPKLGAILANGDGLTLYVFTQDSAGKSVCNDACAATWPPLEAGSAPEVEGATGDFSLITRADGKKQVAFNGRPLYRYAADKAAGDASGQGVGGVWFAAKANGDPPAAAASPAAGSTPGATSVDNPYNY